MFRLSSRRSHRSQGFKVKHALQLFLLICVSIWILYQVRHSREKKAEFEEAARVAKESIKLGRKDLLPRTHTIITHKEDDDKLIDHPQPQGIGNNAEIRTGVGGAVAHENHRVVERETDRIYDPLYTKQHMEDRKEDARGKEDEESEENKDEEESKEHENVEGENEENTNEGKESGEENEGEETKEEAGESNETEENEGKSDEAAREMTYKGDDASSAVAHESLNTTELDMGEAGENKAHEFVRWSNTNSTEAYIHQEERARNMRETEPDDNDRVEGNISTTMDVDEDRNVTQVDPFSTIAKDINELQNSTVAVSNLTGNGKEAENSGANPTQKVFPYRSKSLANSTYSSANFMFRRQSAKSNDENVMSSNTSAGARKKEHVDSSVSEEKDESSNADDVQKLKEIVDYSSVSRKKDESSDENMRFYNSHAQEDTEALSTANNGTNESSLDTWIPQEENDARMDLETLPDSLTAGGNRGEAAAAE